MQRSGKFYPPTTGERTPGTNLIGEWLGSIWFGRFGEQNNFLPLLRNDPTLTYMEIIRFPNTPELRKIIIKLN
jgi:hypothetical protein